MAGNRSLGTLTLELIAKIGGFVAGLDKAGRALDDKGRTMSARAKKIGAAIGIAITAGFTAAVAIGTGLKLAIDRMDDLSKAAQRVQLPTDQFSQLAYAGSLADVSVQDLEGAFSHLIKSMGIANDEGSKQAKLFKALGIDVFDPLTKQMRDPLVLFKEFADVFKDNAQSPELMATGIKLFGESFKKIIPVIKDGSDGLRKAADESDRLGNTLSQEAGEGAEHFNDDLTRLNTAVKGFWQEIAEAALPQLNRFADKMVDYAANADDAKTASNNVGVAIGNIADAAADAIPQIAKLINRLSEASVEADRFRFSVNRDINNAIVNLLPGGGFRDFFKDQAKQAQAQVDKTNGVEVKLPVTILPTVSVTGSIKEFAEAEAKRIKENRKLQDAINAALGPTAKTGGGSRSGGRSSRDRSAEDALRAQQEAEKALQDQIKAVADAKDQFDAYAAQLSGPVADANFRYAQDQQHLNELAKTGEISTNALATAQANLTKEHEKDLEAIEARLNPGKQVLESIQEQTYLLGLNSEQQEIYNNLKYAGKDANDVLKQSIIDSTIELQNAREQAAFLDEVKGQLSDMFVDFVSGAKSAKEAFGDFADAIFKRALQFVADKAVQAMFDAFKGGNSGDTAFGANSYSSNGGGFWSGLLSLFGGGRAGGGPVMAGNVYEVGEYNRPEMLLSGGRQYMIPGNSGRVEPMRSGGVTINNVNNYRAPYDARTEEQKLAKLNYLTGLASRRNN